MKLIYSYIRALHACIATQLNFLNTFILSCNSGAAHRRTRMFLVTGILPVAFFCFLSGALGQTGGAGKAGTVGEIRPLRVGDKVPEEFWTREHIFYVNGITVNRNLEGYRGKPFILDFWASWCGTCRQNFSKNFELEDEVDGKIRFLLVNSDKKESLEKLNAVLTNRNYFKKDTGQSIIWDDTLLGYFPHLPIPHYVWIDHTERVRAITTFEFVSLEQVQRMLARMKGGKQGE